MAVDNQTVDIKNIRNLDALSPKERRSVAEHVAALITQQSHREKYLPKGQDTHDIRVAVEKFYLNGTPLPKKLGLTEARLNEFVDDQINAQEAAVAQAPAQAPEPTPTLSPQPDVLSASAILAPTALSPQPTNPQTMPPMAPAPDSSLWIKIGSASVQEPSTNQTTTNDTIDEAVLVEPTIDKTRPNFINDEQAVPTIVKTMQMNWDKYGVILKENVEDTVNAIVTQMYETYGYNGTMDFISGKTPEQQKAVGMYIKAKAEQNNFVLEEYLKGLPTFKQFAHTQNELEQKGITAPMSNLSEKPKAENNLEQNDNEEATTEALSGPANVNPDALSITGEQDFSNVATGEYKAPKDMIQFSSETLHLFLSALPGFAMERRVLMALQARAKSLNMSLEEFLQKSQNGEMLTVETEENGKKVTKEINAKDLALQTYAQNSQTLATEKSKTDGFVGYNLEKTDDGHMSVFKLYDIQGNEYKFSNGKGSVKLQSSKFATDGAGNLVKQRPAEKFSASTALNLMRGVILSQLDTQSLTERQPIDVTVRSRGLFSVERARDLSIIAALQVAKEENVDLNLNLVSSTFSKKYSTSNYSPMNEDGTIEYKKLDKEAVLQMEAKNIRVKDLVEQFNKQQLEKNQSAGITVEAARHEETGAKNDRSKKPITFMSPTKALTDAASTHEDSPAVQQNHAITPPSRTATKPTAPGMSYH